MLSSLTNIISPTPKAAPASPAPTKTPPPNTAAGELLERSASRGEHGRHPTPQGFFDDLSHPGDGTHQIRRPSTPGKSGFLVNTPVVTIPETTADVVARIVPPSPIITYTKMTANSGRPQTASLSATKKKLEELFTVPTSQLMAVIKTMIKDLEDGLKEDGHTLKCLPSYVTELPDGKESGTYIAMDMGGTNFRICEIGLNRDAGRPVSIRQQAFQLSNAHKNGTGEELFDFMASALSTFLNQTGLPVTSGAPPAVYHIGFTFSYPTLQTGIANGLLMHWTKGLNSSGVVGNDVGKMFQEALERKKVKSATVAALVNDTVGTLAGHAFVNPNTVIGAICGTGTNACYIEDIENIGKWKGEKPKSGKMIINIEWGAFDNEKRVLPLSVYDEQLDASSINPGKQIFEKTIGGMYLGEIARLVAVDLAHRGELFVPSSGKTSDASVPASFLEQWKLDTGHLAQMEVDDTPELEEIQALLKKEFGVADELNTLESRELLQYIAHLVVGRAAVFTATALSAILVKQGFRTRLVDNTSTIAIDGSVFEKYPGFKEAMMDTFRRIFGGFGDNVVLELGKDGSGVGAGVIAALVAKGM
ncbi:glucokinase [Gonapodya sp. JEL0774]|nr:glucokinase [Gonapodya sp. JEL0774]